MGIESDQVVYEYLSRVGDVAQQRQLPSATRMRLVADLRDEIDRRRARAAVDSPAAVRRILDRIGSPDDIVEAAGSAGTAGGAPQPPPAAVPEQREADGGARRRGLRRAVPRPRPVAPPPAPAAPSEAASPPHRAAAHELGDGVTQPDWWRVESGPFGGGGDGVPGFVGGVEIPELLKPPPAKDKDGDEGGKAAAGEADAEPEPATGKAGTGTVAAARRRLPRLWPEGGWNNPLLLVAAALLVAGAVLGSLVPLGLGWLIAYLSRRLSPTQAKWAVLGLPGTVAAAGVVWLWGRTEGRWGEPIAEGGMNDAVAETWPWVLRGAAVATALYLVWRARRPRG
ncbi:hypothetical protein H0H10_38035 [Streptomyces sp. TRM S81-3]|uniref:Uncharacterized protein n=1 Tax=Streptomyces griseicoloratus TaxID=2752516 RepID=A0A926LEC1_9ACTN|nr:hypothetical protein [Streptomyces griseicoloratus]MBD0424908.1 hypothetical protein [Streptomyces griseicoloratus]